jgi:hypothetical protein
MALDDIPKLFGAEEQNGNLVCNPVNDLIPHDVPSPGTWRTSSATSARRA